MENYLFVSYSHADMHIVQSVIRALKQRKFRIWFDDEGKGIPPSVSWSEYIDEKLQGAGKILFFLSRDSIKRPQVIRELRMMMEQKKDILTIMLEEVPFSKIPDEDIKNYFQNVQVMKLRTYGGLNGNFVNALVRLIGVEFSECADEELVQGEEVLLLDRLGEDEKGYIYEDGEPVLEHYADEQIAYDFYKLTPGDISPMMVFPAAMDDQWHPDYMYKERGFYNKNKLSEEIANIRQVLQKNEIMHCLLHYPQVLLNRAFALNAPFVFECYWKNAPGFREEEGQAFSKLVNSGALCIYLMTESHPAEIPAFQVKEEIKRAWINFCKENQVHCLKFDWDKETNLTECKRRLFAPFYEFCITLCDEPYRVASLMDALEIPDEKREEFQKCLVDVRKRVLREGVGFNFSRSQFYRAFVVKKDSSIPEGIFDRRKKFSTELKRIADLKYNCNLADGCQCIFKEAPNSLLRSALAENQVSNALYRKEMKVIDLEYAISEFSLELSGEVTRIPKIQEINFSHVYEIRVKDAYWREYMENKERLSRRANQWMIDFNAMNECMKYFKGFAKELSQKLPEEASVKADDAISIIYQIDNHRITTVYNKTCKKNYYTTNDKIPRKGLSPFSIYFCYGDALNKQLKETICSEILFYQGRTDINGVDFANKIIAVLKEEEFAWKC